MGWLCRDCFSTGADIQAPPDCPDCGASRVMGHGELHALTIAHIDCDAFYATVEKRDDPAACPVCPISGRENVLHFLHSCTFYMHLRCELIRKLESLIDLTEWRRQSPVERAVALLTGFRTFDPDTGEAAVRTVDRNTGEAIEADAKTTKAIDRVINDFLNQAILKRRADMVKFQHSLTHAHASIPQRKIGRAADASYNA